ncbi:MAG: 6-phosphogluconolactonase, partial [Muribaculaceae bacterium]|nr:6-phosphogluconolactonase [Muribaculaceae bacterium]
MKTNLSSQIKLDRIPRRYYHPDDEVELAALTREEKIYTKIFETIYEGSDYVASNIVKYINRYVERSGHCTLALGARMSTHSVYQRLIEMYRAGEVSFNNVIVFNLSEFFPISGDGPSTWRRLHEVFLDHIDIDPANVHTFSAEATRENMYESCRAYDALIERCGGIDVTLCEIGPHGCLAFNEPGSMPSSITRLVLLSNEMRGKISSDYKTDVAPTTAMTIGLKSILASRRVLCMAWGENRAELVRQTVEGPVTSDIPASLLQTHERTKLAVDLGAAEALTRISHPWIVTNCDWTDKMIRRAIVWLCHVTGKPILKLTDKDYNEHGLGEL